MQLCPWEDALYFVYSSNIPTLFFYSHLPAIIVALLVGFLVFKKSNISNLGTALLLIVLLFSAWSIFDLILWATNRPDIVIFFWSMQVLIEPLIYLLGLYLTYVFIKRTDMSFKQKFAIAALYVPVVLLLPTTLNLSGVNLADCTAIEGPIAQYFTYALELAFIISIFVVTDREYRKNSDPQKKKEALTFGLGMVVFLLAFSWGNLIGSFTENWTLAQAGLIGMPIFTAFLAYLIVRFHSFNMKLFGAQVLVFALGFLVLGIIFIRSIENVRLVVAVTLLLIFIIGSVLIRGIKKEIEQREELAKLNIDLQNLLKQRESLVHLITHKIKGSFTYTKVLFAGMLDGTFGDISPEIKKRSEQGMEFNNAGLRTVDLVLNVANMQSGTIKYEMKPVDFRNLVAASIGEKKIEAEKKGLAMEGKFEGGTFSVLGDAFWLKESVNNLIENSIKYTKEGGITVTLEHTKENKILLSVKDTGIGIAPEDKEHLFTEGGRGKESVKMNVDSTGYGLYSVKLIIEAHEGRVWGNSEGPGRGSQFYIELNPTS
ncbi:hypothetical protein A2737_02045 [Candidatus Nomurabacteria bacterium RIFCSPHIGHO2_01_FULL_41_71]|nr:MAG: hypothetical protein A2737_02045 [Candidatus Nomurabacteria bacterium RIFCSPHIGHO2_01_FULL_41_71]OGI89483.1 MAG: hypothetical protein A3B01_01165 [Candidatus Nomurabacteria bacterium RIFCSPLOWO2_01_FULL_41_52b]